MPSLPRLTPRDSGLAQRPWELVRRWPGLRGEPKLAWLWLWHTSDQGGRLVSVRPCDLGRDQGTSDDAGARYLDSLAAEGLIVVRDRDARSGVRLVEVLDPERVARARPVEWDGQRLLAFLEGDDQATPATACRSPASNSDTEAHPTSEPEPDQPGGGFGCDSVARFAADLRTCSADPRAEPRRERGSAGGTAERAPLDPSEILDLSRTLPSDPSDPSAHCEQVSATDGSDVPRRAAAEVPAEPRSGGANPFAEALARLPPAPDVAGRQELVDRLVAEWRRRLRDAGTRDMPLVRIAWALVDGEIRQSDVDGVWRSLERLELAGELHEGRGRYFVGTLKFRVFPRRGARWGG